MSEYFRHKGEVVLRIYNEHDEGPPEDYHEWITLGNAATAANTEGLPNPRMNDVNWIYLQCNNADCQAMALMHPVRVLKMLTDQRDGT